MATGLGTEQRNSRVHQGGSRRGTSALSVLRREGRACELGDVYGRHTCARHGKWCDHLERLFRCLDEVTKRCPQGCVKRLPLASMIVHLNDDHRLTREQIAEWLTTESNS